MSIVGEIIHEQHKRQINELVEVLGELVELVEAAYKGEYEIDSFTTQPAKLILMKYKE